ncbi:MAG: hypothetical protein WA941_09220 [Nitrososphaeraceae archaeon]
MSKSKLMAGSDITKPLARSLGFHPLAWPAWVVSVEVTLFIKLLAGFVDVYLL